MGHSTGSLLNTVVKSLKIHTVTKVFYCERESYFGW